MTDTPRSPRIARGGDQHVGATQTLQISRGPGAIEAHGTAGKAVQRLLLKAEAPPRASKKM